jgi:hypothetical protein
MQRPRCANAELALQGAFLQHLSTDPENVRSQPSAITCGF